MADHSGSRTTDTDAFAFRMERDPLLRSTIVALVMLDRSPDWDVLMDRVERATLLAPAFRQRLAPAGIGPGNPRWELDEDFDLTWHLRRVVAPSPGDLDSLLELARVAGMAAFDPARPLWEFTLVEGLTGATAALMLKVHHALTDGIGGIELASHVVDLERDPAEPPAPAPAAPRPRREGPVERFVDTASSDVRRVAALGWTGATRLPVTLARGARHPLRSTRDAVTTAAALARFARPITTTLSPVMVQRRLQWQYRTLEVPVADLKAAARSCGGTLNDAFLAAVSGGLRRYHTVHHSSAEELLVTMPISVRGATDPVAGNRITLMRFGIPVSTIDPAERMRAIRGVVARLRADPAIPYSGAIAGLLNLLPPAVAGSMLKHVDVLATNIPGFDQHVYIGGARIEAFYSLGPTVGAAVNVGLMSYAGTAYVGLTTNNGAVPDPEVFRTCMSEGFDEVLALG